MYKANTIFFGAEGATDVETTSVGSREFVSGETTGLKAIPLSTDAIQEYVDGTLSNYGLLLKMDVETGFLKTFDSSDSTTAANRPQLVIEYTVPQEEPDWVNKSYSYGDSNHQHAVTSLTLTDEYNNQIVNTYRYDANGRGWCTPEPLL